MVDDFGYLILKNVSKMAFPIDDICNAVERSNNLKKKARIVEGSRTRVEPDEAELLLKSGELILCIVGLYHLLKGWKGHGSPINLSDVRLIGDLHENINIFISSDHETNIGTTCPFRSLFTTLGLVLPKTVNWGIFDRH